MIEDTWTHLALHLEHENWMMAQVMALPEEAQEKYMHGKDHDDEDMEMLSLIQKHTGYFSI